LRAHFFPFVSRFYFSNKITFIYLFLSDNITKKANGKGKGVRKDQFCEQDRSGDIVPPREDEEEK